MKGILVFATVALVWPAVAAAQDYVVFSPKATTACLAETEGNARLDCIGKGAEQCMESDAGSTTAGSGRCLARELGYWDDRLKIAFDRLTRVEAENDAEMRELGSSALSTAESLEAMALAWVPFRTASCGYELSTWGGGSGGGPATTACVMHETARMALILEDRLEERTPE